jgi:hypothetical protein
VRLLQMIEQKHQLKDSKILAGHLLRLKDSKGQPMSMESIKVCCEAYVSLYV